MDREYFVFTRRKPRGLWQVLRDKGIKDGTSAHKLYMNQRRSNAGSDVRLIHIEPMEWTPESIAEIQRRGLLPA